MHSIFNEYKSCWIFYFYISSRFDLIVIHTRKKLNRLFEEDQAEENELKIESVV